MAICESSRSSRANSSPAEKKASRVAADGAVVTDNSAYTTLEINSETDFAAKDSQFKILQLKSLITYLIIKLMI